MAPGLFLVDPEVSVLRVASHKPRFFPESMTSREGLQLEYMNEQTVNEPCSISELYFLGLL